MINANDWWAQSHRCVFNRILAHSRAGCLMLLLSFACLSAFVESADAQNGPREQYIPILCVTTGDKPAGMVMYLMVLFAKKDDSGWLDVHFLSGPGRLSQKAKTATTRAISSAARAMGLSADAWSVGLSVPYPGLIIDGDSLSAMVGLAVVAMAKGEAVPHHRVISGTITSEGRIGPVGHVGLKVAVANQAGLRMVLVSSATSDGLATPSPIQVSQIGTVSQAYRALMAPRSLFADGHSHETDANQS